MKVILLTLICVLFCSSHQLSLNTNQSAGTGTSNRTTTASDKTSISFIGTVRSIEPLGKRELQVIPVDFDSRFAITVHIESVTPSDVPLKSGTEQIFAVHSPAKLFGAMEEDMVGRKLSFKVAWDAVNNTSGFSDLTASPIVDEQMQTNEVQQPCPVDLPCNGIPRFMEYGNVRDRDERPVLDHLAKALRMSPDQIAYVLIYAGQEACVDEARLRALRIKSYLIKKHGIVADRIVWKDGGFKVDLSTELWLLPRTSRLPEASPQLDRVQVNRGKCKLRSFNSQ